MLSTVDGKRKRVQNVNRKWLLNSITNPIDKG